MRKISTLKLSSYIEQIHSQFHILDSLAIELPTREEKRLQMILLQYFKDESFEKGRIAMNFAKVIPLKIYKICCFNQLLRCLVKTTNTIVAVSLFFSGRNFLTTQRPPWPFLGLYLSFILMIPILILISRLVLLPV